MKKCSKCKKLKEYSEFPKNNTKSDGCGTYCKNCRKQYDSKYYQKNKEKMNLYRYINRKRQTKNELENKYLEGKIDGYKEAIQELKHLVELRH
mgnify:CR=1 FL=1